MTLFDVSMGEAEFSPCRQWRYLLRRRWEGGDGLLNFVMLNPSTADEFANDPTIERCQRRAKALGYAGLTVTNLFAWRSTDPAALTKVADPIGPANDAAIVRAAGEASMVICAWGAHGSIGWRCRHVKRLLVEAGHADKLHHLGQTHEGHPRHPLYVSYAVSPIPWRFEIEKSVTA